AVRAHLPPPPPLPHHRGGGGDPDAPGRRLHVRLHVPGRTQGGVTRMITDDELSKRARALAGAIEPFAGQVYFSPECHEGYAGLGFSGSPGTFGDVAAPDGSAYFCSRGSVMGQVPGELVAAAFAVFNPAIVVPLVAHGWTITDAATICDARTGGAVGQLARPPGAPPGGPAPAGERLAPAAGPPRAAGSARLGGAAARGGACE